MALQFLFQVTAIDSTTQENKTYDVKYDDLTLAVSVWDGITEVDALPDATNPNTGILFTRTDASEVNVTYIGADTFPFAVFPVQGTFIRTECFGYDLCNIDAAGDGYEVQGALVEANSTECGFVPSLVITGQITHATCFGSSTGAIALTVTDGSGPYSYQWADGPTTKDRTALKAGEYTVTVTDAAGTSGSKSFTVGQNTEIKVTAQVDDDSITIIPSGGVAPYTYAWADGPTTKDRTALTIGKYYLTVTDSVGCYKSFVFSIGLARFYFSHAPVLLELQAQNLASKPNLTFLCDVMVEKDYLSGNFENVATLEHVADKDGSTVFEVQEFLQPFLQPHFPAIGANTVTRAESTFKRFYLRYAEKFGTTPVVGDATVEDYRYVIRGGLSFEQANQDTFYASYLPTQKPFMSWLPLTKLATTEQPEYLYFLLFQNGITAFNVKVRVQYADDTTAVSTAYQQSGCLRFELFCIPTGYQALNLAAVNKEVKSWQVWCEDANGVAISEVRTYSIDTRYFRKRRYLLYTNSLGGVNTLAAVGLAEKELTVKTETRSLVLHGAYDVTAGDASITDIQAAPALRLTSGYLDSQQELEALTDFVLSREVRLVEESRYRAGTKEVKKFMQLSEEDTLKYVDFDFVLPVERFYTPTL